MAGKKITKADIVDSVYLKTGISRKEIRQAIDLFLGEIKEALVSGTNIELRGFGTFEVRVRKGRSRARNPRTGTVVQVYSHGIAAFRPGKELKQDVWNVAKAASPEGSAPPPKETLQRGVDETRPKSAKTASSTRSAPAKPLKEDELPRKAVE
jgi:integration host factor subunit beta